MKIYKISLDWDNVLYNLEKIHINYIKEKYNKTISSLEVTSWDYYPNNYPDIPLIWSNFDLYRKGELIPDAIKFVNTLNDMYGLENIQIVTHSYEDIIKDKDVFISNFFPGIKVFHAKEKSKYTKGSVLIDDGMHNITSHVKNNKNLGIIFDLDYGWNKEDQSNKLIKRAKSYDDVISILKGVQG